MSLDALYQQIILDHNKKRVGYGLHDGGFPSHQYNPTCGDEITLTVRLSDDGASITGIEWEGKGCSISQASASLMVSEVVGMSVEEFQEFANGFRDVMRSRGQKTLPEEDFGDLAALSGVSKFVARVKCAMLAWVAAEDSLRQTRESLH